MPVEVLRFADRSGRVVRLWDDRWRHVLRRLSELVALVPDLFAGSKRR